MDYLDTVISFSSDIGITVDLDEFKIRARSDKFIELLFSFFTSMQFDKGDEEIIGITEDSKKKRRKHSRK